MLKALLVTVQKEMKNVLLELEKGDPSYTVAGSLAELCPPVMWKSELQAQT